MSGPTPAPWHVVEYGEGNLVICADPAGERRICFMATSNGDPEQTAEIEANAAAIAAVPQMLVALEEARADFELAAQVGIADAYLVVELRALCERHGYGNVMASASALWRQELGALAGGEFAAGPCRATVERQVRRLSAVLKAAKP